MRVSKVGDDVPSKWAKLRDFRRNFTLADVLHAAVAAMGEASNLPAHGERAFRLRQKAIGYALLVNSGDRQGDLRQYRIGADLTPEDDGLWYHGIRQSKTRRKKEIDALWPGTSALIDAHVLMGRPGWMLDEQIATCEGLNLLTLQVSSVHEAFMTNRLKEDFGISGHLIRTAIADLIRRHRPDAAWANQDMLGHTDCHMQATYKSDFDESAAVAAMDARYGAIEERAGT